MIAQPTKSDLTRSAIQDLRQLPKARDPETHLYVVWMNYSDHFIDLEWYLKTVANSTVNVGCKRVAIELLNASKKAGRWA